MAHFSYIWIACGVAPRKYYGTTVRLGDSLCAPLGGKNDERPARIKRIPMQLDLNHLGLAIGLLALILAIPLSVAANLVTPKIQNWLSSRSLQKLQARILDLEVDLKVAEEETLFSEAEWTIYEFVYRGRMVQGIAFHAILGIAWALLIGYYHQLRDQPALSGAVWMLPTLSFLALLANGILTEFARWQYRLVKRRRTAKGRAELRKALDELMAKAGK
jgi:hypothetical protein